MVLNKQTIQTTRWNNDNHQWWIGETTEYRWTDIKNKPVSNWMDLDNALQWIKEYDSLNKH